MKSLNLTKNRIYCSFIAVLDVLMVSLRKLCIITELPIFNKNPSPYPYALIRYYIYISHHQTVSQILQNDGSTGSLTLNSTDMSIPYQCYLHIEEVYTQDMQDATKLLFLIKEEGLKLTISVSSTELSGRAVYQALLEIIEREFCSYSLEALGGGDTKNFEMLTNLREQIDLEDKLCTLRSPVIHLQAFMVRITV